MKRITIIILLLASLSGISTAQKFRFEAGYGFASNSMNDLKLAYDMILKGLPVAGKITDDFPSLPFESFAITAQLGEAFIFGLTGTHNTTGARISYKDFSGEYKFDSKLTSWTPGLRIGANLFKGKISVSGFADVAYSFTKLKTDEIMLTFKEKKSYKANSFSVQPQIRLSHQIRQFEISLNGGYQYDFGGVFTLGGNKMINTITDESVSANWSGYRFMLNLGYCFRKSKPVLPE